MNHYEVMILIHPDQTDQVGEMIKRLCDSLKDNGAVIHRSENCGRRKLVYPIDKHLKAHYALINFESESGVLAILRKAFQYNDAVLRHVITKRKAAMTGKTALLIEDETDKKYVIDQGDEVIDYKNVYFLKRYMMETGRIVPSRVSGFSAKAQRQLSHAIKLARQVALIPYCDRHF